MKTEAAVNFIVEDSVPGHLRLRISTDALNFKGNNYLSQSLHTDLTPIEAKDLAAELHARADAIQKKRFEDAGAVPNPTADWPEIPHLKPIMATVRKFTAPELVDKG